MFAEYFHAIGDIYSGVELLLEDQSKNSHFLYKLVATCFFCFCFFVVVFFLCV